MKEKSTNYYKYTQILYITQNHDDLK